MPHCDAEWKCWFVKVSWPRSFANTQSMFSLLNRILFKKKLQPILTHDKLISRSEKKKHSRIIIILQWDCKQQWCAVICKHSNVRNNTKICIILYLDYFRCVCLRRSSCMSDTFPLPDFLQRTSLNGYTHCWFWFETSKSKNQMSFRAHNWDPTLQHCVVFLHTDILQKDSHYDQDAAGTWAGRAKLWGRQWRGLQVLFPLSLW